MARGIYIRYTLYTVVYTLYGPKPSLTSCITNGRVVIGRPAGPESALLLPLQRWTTQQSNQRAVLLMLCFGIELIGLMD